ncbi:MAG: FixH family protein [Pseudomonadota bacterium]
MSMVMREREQERQLHRPTRWYRQFWPWFVLALLLWGISSSLITLTFAVRNPPEMMTGDYAKLGKALVDTHVRADRAEAMGLSAAIERGDEGWTLRLSALAPTELDEQLLLVAQHPTDASQDRSILLRRSGAVGSLIYRAEADAQAVDVPSRGRLIVSNATQDWWISSRYELRGGRIQAELTPERL